MGGGGIREDFPIEKVILKRRRRIVRSMGDNYLTRKFDTNVIQSPAERILYYAPTISQ